jgi:hypothetical protein
MTDHPVRRRLLSFFAALSLLGVPAVAEAAPAAASPADCTPPAHGFVRVTSGDNAHVVSYFNNGPTTTSLQWKYVGGVQVGYAYLGGSVVVGDLVWMDWTTNNGRSWLQCGPFPIQQYFVGRRTYGKATSSNPSYRFRACSRLLGDANSYCTPWW